MASLQRRTGDEKAAFAIGVSSLFSKDRIQLTVWATLKAIIVLEKVLSFPRAAVSLAQRPSVPLGFPSVLRRRSRR